MHGKTEGMVILGALYQVWGASWEWSTFHSMFTQLLVKGQIMQLTVPGQLALGNNHSE